MSDIIITSGIVLVLNRKDALYKEKYGKCVKKFFKELYKNARQ